MARTAMGELWRKSRIPGETGAQGDTGPEGPEGPAPTILSGISAPTTQGEEGDIYIQTDSDENLLKMYHKGSGSWSTLAEAVTPTDVAAVPRFSGGSNVPSGGNDGDWYIYGNGGIFYLYAKSAGSWDVQMSWISA